MHKSIIVALLVGACAALNVSAQGTSPAAKGTLPSPQDSTQLSSPPVAGSEDHKVKAKLDDTAFVAKAALASLTEIKVARLAIKNGTTRAIRDFAATMLKDHNASNKKLRAAAAPGNTPIPNQLDQPHLATVAKLAGLSGRDFDDAYISLMKQEHDASVALFENAASEQSLSADLRNFATASLDTLRSHQLQAHNLTGAVTKVWR